MCWVELFEMKLCWLNYLKGNSITEGKRNVGGTLFLPFDITMEANISRTLTE